MSSYALQVLWQVETVRRNHRAALDYANKSLAAVEGKPELADLQVSLLENRILSLQSLDRLDEATRDLGTAQNLVGQRSSPDRMHVTAAIHQYWVGEWDGVLTELAVAREAGLDSMFFGNRDRSPILQLFGVAALVSGRRGVVVDMVTYLEEADEYRLETAANEENRDFLIAAQALAAEQRGRKEEALNRYRPILDTDRAPMMFRHQWLPAITRLALDLGDRDTALQAVSICEKESARETTPARATFAASWCRGLLDSDAEALREVVQHYRQVGRRAELASALPDLAVLHASHGEVAAAQHTLAAALDLSASLGAAWDVSQAIVRMQEYGIRHATTLDADRTDEHGQLTSAELAVAELVASGAANPDIAIQLQMPRAAVHVHIAKIIDKLGVESRSGITRWVLTRPR
jgi:ATP/maltotriose-dependent transcriptional regulator MalT